MSKRTRWSVGVALLVCAAALVVPAVVFAGPDGTASVRFGNPDAGSFIPEEVENGSFNAQDNLIPRTSVITGSPTANVEFVVAGFHQPMVYEPGTTPDDIVVPPFPPNLVMPPSPGLLAAGPSPFSGFQGPWSPPAGTFDEPGRYFILCNVTPHFAFGKMYGWVDVK